MSTEQIRADTESLIAAGVDANVAVETANAVALHPELLRNIAALEEPEEEPPVRQSNRRVPVKMSKYLNPHGQYQYKTVIQGQIQK